MRNKKRLFNFIGLCSCLLRTTYGRHDGVGDEDLALRDDDLRGVDQRARLSDLQDLHARQSLLRTPAEHDGWARSRRLAEGFQTRLKTFYLNSFFV